ncbi:hydroxyectoine utilization dehydratase EutB [Alteribacillus sp. HJP-4]|uniref:hydroxyectoine utilization dehydratase EutB n=1 Tax=Alteribacillus sp. HJP-4 TaxID=2775394 RepID=UPI0035CD0953
MESVTMKHVWKARKRIRGLLAPTPLLPSQELSRLTGSPVYLKLEQMQPSASFKLRGATNMIASLPDKSRQKGIVTFSTGNHGFAVAMAANELGIRAVVCVSERVPEAKISALRVSGAELHIEGDGQDEAGDVARRLEMEEGLTLIPPFDHPEIIAGQGTMGLEILEELPDVNAVLAGLSGGGLLSGLGLALKKTDPAIQVIGISVEKGAAMNDSIRAGKPVQISEYPTLADSLLGGIGLDNIYTFSMVKQYVDQRLSISEESIAKGMAFLYEKHRLVVEGAAAVGVGALLDGSFQPDGPTVLVITGNSISAAEHYQSVRPFLQDRT